MRNNPSSSFKHVNSFEKGINSLMAYLVIMFQCFPGVLAFAAEPEPDAAMIEAGDIEHVDGLPPGAATLGIRFSDDDFALSIEGMAPIFWNQDFGVLFIDARSSANDRSEQETNLGLAWRKLIDQKAIVGLNAFWDSRWTGSGNRFDQLGLGGEILTKRFDARFNYYIPEHGEKLANSYETSETNRTSSTSTSTTQVFGDVVAAGNSITQEIGTETRRTTTTQTSITRYLFEQYEAALEGWDAEVGYLLPENRLGEARVFAGYQYFQNPYGDSLEGFKARAELKVTPNIILDAEFFEEEALNSTEFYFGGRFHVPMDLKALANGRNPFSLNQVQTGLAGRIADPVIRDLKIQAAISELEEVVEERTTSTSTSSSTELVGTTTETVQLSGGSVPAVLIVVDSNNNTGIEDGTFENPYNTFEEGERSVELGLGSLYVFGRGIDYNTQEDGLVLPDGANAFGSGAAVTGFGGKSLPAGMYPKVIGSGNAPVFTLGEGSTVSGFHIIQPPIYVVSSAGLKTTPNGLSYDPGKVGILSPNKNNIKVLNNKFDQVHFGALLMHKIAAPTDTFKALISGNSSDDYRVEAGIRVDSLGFMGSGSADIEIRENNFSNSSDTGIEVVATGYNAIKFLSESNTVRSVQSGHGIGASLGGFDVVASSLGDTVIDNGSFGDSGLYFDIQLQDNGSFEGTISNLTANLNGRGVFVKVSAKNHIAKSEISLVNVEANRNLVGGLTIENIVRGGTIDVTQISLTDVEANNNTDLGVVVRNTALNIGNSEITFNRVQANSNQGSGIILASSARGGTLTKSKISLEDVEASNNDHSAYMAIANGITVSVVAGTIGDTEIALNRVQAISNKNYGVELTPYGDTMGTSKITLTASDANFNRKGGVRIQAGPAVTSEVTLTDIDAHNNGFEDGVNIRVQAPGSPHTSTVTLNAVRANSNNGNGVEVTANAMAPSTVDISGATAIGNGGPQRVVNGITIP